VVVVVGEVVGVVVGGGGGDVVGVVVGGAGGVVEGVGIVAGGGDVAGVGVVARVVDVEGVVAVGAGVVGVSDAAGKDVPGSVAIATTDHAPQVSVTFPWISPGALSPENQ
jgi:hypothetical protein